MLGPDEAIANASLVATNSDFGSGLTQLANSDMPNGMSLAENAGSMARDTVMSTIRSKVNILPFRGIIRKVSGADLHQKRLAAAYQAGKLRRAYLVGIAEMRFGSKCLGSKPIVIEAKADAEP